MAQVYFHCSSTRGIIRDAHGVDVESISEAPALATCFVRALVAAPGREDWRSWVLHVSNAQGDEIFVMPFATVLGRPH